MGGHRHAAAPSRRCVALNAPAYHPQRQPLRALGAIFALALALALALARVSTHRGGAQRAAVQRTVSEELAACQLRARAGPSLREGRGVSD